MHPIPQHLRTLGLSATVILALLQPQASQASNQNALSNLPDEVTPMNTNAASRIISHQTELPDLYGKIEQVKRRIEDKGDLPHATVSEQLEILNQVPDSSFGREIFLRAGITGVMTQRMCLHPVTPQNEPLSPLDDFLLNHAPSVKATQQRFQIFKKLLQEEVRENVVMASCPCGTMDDLLGLDFTGINAYQLVGIDLAADSLDLAADNARQHQQQYHTEFMQQDAWHMDVENTFDVITSNGLNIYEPNNERVIDLYRAFYKALKPGGVLITSFLTPPPSAAGESPWKMARIDSENLRRQRIFMADLTQVQFMNFRSYEQTETQLFQAGFSDLIFHEDEANMFPTVIARKPS
ncbi:MAG: class I SAM-dependent methyltransferase [Holosporales bacterium]